ncbi:MAG: type-F conjugative transfer system pilin assembly protein TrbC [Alphaproteobacteria bacterium]|nr:type-F conjugative transfer system pilin assembly protein TrbC [Alphaproteobacteria bacterium]
MLRALTFISIFSISYAANARLEDPSGRCRTSPVLELARKDGLYQKIAPHDSFFKLLQQESCSKVEALNQNKDFQEVVAELQNKASNSPNILSNANTEPESALCEASLYIFVSFSLGEKALLNLAHDAKQFGATLVLRGFREGSYTKTAQSLQKVITKTGQGVFIDPELYTLFDIRAVPTYVLAKPFLLESQEGIQTPLHDKLQGHVSAHYALETFAKEGDLKKEAQTLLKRGILK